MSDFAAGAQVGDSIQRRLLAKKLKEQETTRAAEQQIYDRGLDTADAQRREKEFAALQEDRAANRAAVAKRLGLSERELAQREAIAATMQGNSITKSFGDAMSSGLENRERKARIALLEQKANGGSGGAGAGWTTTEEINPETGDVISVRNTSRGSGLMPSNAPWAKAQEPRDPVADAKEAAGLRVDLQKLNAKVAANDNFAGPDWLGWGEDRRVQAAGKQARLDQLGQVAQDLRAAQRMARMPAGIQQQYQQTQPAPSGAPATQPGQQGGAVLMIAPNGARGMIPADQVQAATAKGYRRG